MFRLIMGLFLKWLDKFKSQLTNKIQHFKLFYVIWIHFQFSNNVNNLVEPYQIVYNLWGKNIVKKIWYNFT